MANCNFLEQAIVCFTPDATNTTTTTPLSLFVVAKYPEEGGDPSFVYTDANLAVVDISTLGVGTLSAGQCPVTPPVVEWFPMCDVFTDPVTNVTTKTKFFRQCLTFFDQATLEPTTTVSDFEEDKQTPYTLLGEAQTCPEECPPLVNTGVVTSWGELM